MLSAMTTEGLAEALVSILRSVTDRIPDPPFVAKEMEEMAIRPNDRLLSQRENRVYREALFPVRRADPTSYPMDGLTDKVDWLEA